MRLPPCYNPERMNVAHAFATSDYRVRVPAAPVRDAASSDAVWVTEVVLGEPVHVLERSGRWARILLPLQPSSLDERGYPGWVLQETLISSSDQPRYQVITARAPITNQLGRLCGELPLGAFLCGSEMGGDAEVVHLHNTTGLPGSVRSADIAPCPLAVTGRDTVLSTLDVWRSLPYVWGGTSSCTGTDCSGLVYRTYGRAGIAVPRDAHDQFSMAPRRGEGDLADVLPGDLVFFRRPTDDEISHVGVYLGDGMYLSTKRNRNVCVDPVLDDPYCGWASYFDA